MKLDPDEKSLSGGSEGRCLLRFIEPGWEVVPSVRPALPVLQSSTHGAVPSGPSGFLSSATDVSCPRVLILQNKCPKTIIPLTTVSSIKIESTRYLYEGRLEHP